MRHFYFSREMMYIIDMSKLADDSYCFVCGPKNTRGFQLKFRAGPDTRSLFSEVTFPAEFQGWKGIVHGGLVATVLDEIMVKCADYNGYTCMTAELQVRYRKPVKVSEKYRLTAVVEPGDRRLVQATARLADSRDLTVAEARGRLFVMVSGGKEG